MVEELRKAEAPKAPVNMASLSLDLIRARRQTEQAFPLNERDGWAREAVTTGTVTAGVVAFARWLATRV